MPGLIVILSSCLFIASTAFSKEPVEIFREKFQRSKEDPTLQDLNIGKQWDRYFIGVGTTAFSYSSTYRFEDFNEVIRGTYNVTKIHSYSFTSEGFPLFDVPTGYLHKIIYSNCRRWKTCG